MTSYQPASHVAVASTHYAYLRRAVKIRDVVLETAVLVSRALETDFYRSWSCSRRVGLEYFSRPTVYLAVYLLPIFLQIIIDTIIIIKKMLDYYFYYDTVLCDLVFARPARNSLLSCKLDINQCL